MINPIGRWVQRIPKSMYEELKGIAKTDGVSLNQWVLMAISERVGKYDERNGRHDAGDPA